MSSLVLDFSTTYCIVARVNPSRSRAFVRVCTAGPRLPFCVIITVVSPLCIRYIGSIVRYIVGCVDKVK